MINNLDKSKDLFKSSVEKAKKYQNTYNAFVTILDESNEIETNHVLNKVPYALKDNFSTSNILTTGSSNILKNYVPVYDATVYRKLKEAGALLVGKTVLDELAMGGTSLTGHTGPVLNPYDTSRQIGGSSGGSAAAVALNIVPFSIGSDTGDSVRKPASYAGVIGFKPTYGRISRYGLFAFASSLDHVAVFAKSTKDIAIVTDTIKGRDNLDMTTLPDEGYNYSDLLEEQIENKKLCYIKEIINKDMINSEDIELGKTTKLFFETLEKLEKIGFTIEEKSMDKELLKAIYPTYLTISCAEATSNNANLTGIQFGVRGIGESIEEIMIDARTKGFSELIKRRFIIGSYILQKENQEKLFLNAGRVRRLIVENTKELFKDYAGLILPASGGIAPLIKDSSDQVTDRLSDRSLILENHLAIGNFGGFPSITLPMGLVDNLPVGINITSEVLTDCELLKIANVVEKEINFKYLKED